MKLQHELERLDKTGKIDSVNGAEHVGMVLDMHNDMVNKKVEKDYEHEMHAMNGYYYKLWQRAVDSIRNGEKASPKKEKRFSLHAAPQYGSGKIIKPKTPEPGTIFLADGSKA